jgi:hypothetical protein
MTRQVLTGSPVHFLQSMDPGSPDLTVSKTHVGKLPCSVDLRSP